MQPWSLSESRPANAGAFVGAVLMIAGGVVLLGSLALPWQRVDLQELFGADIPSFTLKGLSTGIGKIAGLMAATTVGAAIILLVLGPKRRSPGIVVIGLVGAIGAAMVTIVGLFGSAAIGLAVGLGGAVIAAIGAVLSAATVARRRRTG